MVEFFDEALDALAAIRGDDRFSPDRAFEIAQKIVARCNLLGTEPHGRYKGRKHGTFEIIVQPFVIVFAIDKAGAKILNIWHGRESRGEAG